MIEHLVLTFLLLAMARAVFFRWSAPTVMHDPVSALLAAIGPEVLSAGAAEVGTAAAADAGIAAGAAGAADAAAITLPEVLTTAPAIAGAAAPDALAAAAVPGLAAAAPAVAGDFVGAGSSAAEALAGVAPAIASGSDAVSLGLGFDALPADAGGASSGLPTATPGASSLSTAPTPTLASSPAAAAPSPEFSAAASDASGYSGSSSAAGLPAGAGGGGSFSGPVAGTPASAGAGASPVPGFTAEQLGLPSGPAGGYPDIPRPAIPAAGAAPSSSGILDNIGLGGVGKFFKDNKELFGILGAGASILPLLFRNNGPSNIINTPEATNATALAGTTGATSEALQSAALTGQLPAGYQSAIDQAKASSAAVIRSRYAQLGESGSTAEATDIANNAASIEGQRAQLLEQLTTQGISAASTAGGLDTNLIKLQLEQDQELQKALGTLASNLMLSTLPSRVSAATA